MSLSSLVRLTGIATSLAFLVSLPAQLLPDAADFRKLRLVEPPTESRRPCDGVIAARPLVILVLGQSNAANHGILAAEDAYRKVASIQGNHCFESADPLPGATGRGGSIWPRLGQMLAPQPVAFSILAVESTAIADWVNPGVLNWELRQRLRTLRRNGVGIDLVVWQQGEADAKAGTSHESYRRDFLRLVSFFRDMGMTSPVMVALSTYCRGGAGSEIRSAVYDVASRRSDVLVGPDTDQLGGDFRSDDCHFSRSGLDAAARLWAEAIVPHIPRLLAARQHERSI